MSGRKGILGGMPEENAGTEPRGQAETGVAMGEWRGGQGLIALLTAPGGKFCPCVPLMMKQGERGDLPPGVHGWVAGQAGRWKLELEAGQRQKLLGWTMRQDGQSWRPGCPVGRTGPGRGSAWGKGRGLVKVGSWGGMRWGGGKEERRF